MYVNAQENNEFKGLKGLKKSKNKRRIDILTAKKQRVCEKKYTFAPKLRKKMLHEEYTKLLHHCSY